MKHVSILGGNPPNDRHFPTTLETVFDAIEKVLLQLLCVRDQINVYHGKAMSTVLLERISVDLEG